MNTRLTFNVFDTNVVVTMSIGNPSDYCGRFRFKHKLTIWKGDRSNKTTFTFYDGTETPNEESIREALGGILADAFCADMYYMDYCQQIGVNPDDKESERAWVGCKKTLCQLECIGLGEKWLDEINEKLG